MTNALPLIRLAANLVGSYGVSKVITDIVKNNTNVETTFDAVKVTAGGLVLGSMIVEHASNHVNEQISSMYAWWQSKKEDEPTK